MKELAQHIKVLLLQQSCVIVPDFGGFVTRYVSARYDAEEQVFLPPRRAVAYNPSLTADDGLLVQSYMRTYHISYSEAAQRIGEAVKEGKETLRREQALTLNGIGQFSVMPNGQYDFTPDEQGIFAPELYGLPLLDIALRTDNEEQAEKEAETPKERKTYTLRLNRELVNYVATAAVAILFYFIWSSPVADPQRKDAGQAAYSAFTPAVPAATQAQAEPAAPQPAEQVPTAAATTAVPEKAETPTTENRPTAEVVPEKGNFTIVLVSRVTKKNAERFTQRLREKGTLGASVYVKGKMVRVIYGNYADEADAYTALNKLRNDLPEFSDAWVLELK